MSASDWISNVVTRKKGDCKKTKLRLYNNFVGTEEPSVSERALKQNEILEKTRR